MTSDIKGLEQWEGEAQEWALKAGSLKMAAGVGVIEALENWYTPRNRREYLTWRLRLHLRFNNDPEFLDELDETFNIGLRDDEVGKTLWEIPAEQNTGFTNGFNWRTDSGNALKGRSRRKVDEDAQEDLEE